MRVNRMGKVALVLVAAALLVTPLLAGCARRGAVDIKSEKDLVGKVVGVQIDTTGQFTAEKIEGIKEIRKYDTILLAFQALEQGKIDAIMNDYPVNAYMSKKRGKTKVVAKVKTDEKYGIGIKKENTRLLEGVNKALAAIKADGTYDTIYKKWFGTKPPAGEEAATSAPAAPGQVVATVKTLKPGVLMMGSDTTYPPFENMVKGKAVGFDVDLATEIARRLGLKLEVVSTAWDGIIPGLKADKFDILMSAMTITEERSKEISFSDPYIDSDQSICVKK